MRIVFADGWRHRRISGYGMLARNLILGLTDLGHEVVIESASAEPVWEEVEPGSDERIQRLPTWNPHREADGDLVLQIGSPPHARRVALPSLMYTMHALTRLPRAWVDAVQQVDGVIVPSEYDRRVFSRDVEHIWVAHCASATDLFKPRPDWRHEGPDEFTFLFVGSYSWRKGADILLRAFLEEFRPTEPVRLWLYCVGAGDVDATNHMLDLIQGIEPMARVRLFSRRFSPAWMHRFCNRVDAAVTFSRGEGWCLPINESLLCKKPVIAPASTGFLEYLDPSISYLVPTREVAILDVKDEFAAAMVSKYGEEGISCHEVQIPAARAAMREVYEESTHWTEAAERGARRLRTTFTRKAMAEQVEAACRELLAFGS